ncbi:MAG: hypothetical protein Q8O76_10225 [Chloroflexota bacterium]|nr:hypothetical protein [Chloroflexota bacterium]
MFKAGDILQEKVGGSSHSPRHIYWAVTRVETNIKAHLVGYYGLRYKRATDVTFGRERFITIIKEPTVSGFTVVGVWG